MQRMDTCLNMFLFIENKGFFWNYVDCPKNSSNRKDGIPTEATFRFSVFGISFWIEGVECQKRE
jgi:hypothetical protein